MNFKRVSLLLLTVTALLMSPGFVPADEKDGKWEQKYEQLLKDRPEIRTKVESGGATKEQVIQWLKDGGGRKKSNKKYYGAKVGAKDPAKFRKSGEKVVYSGPQPGEKLPGFKATGLRGARKGDVYDPVAAANGKPLVLIFQDNSVVGQKGLLLAGPTLARIAKKSPVGLRVSATFLVDDPTPNLIFEYDFMHEIDDVIQMSVSPDRRDGPGAYGLNRNVAMTIMVARDGVVLHNFAFTQPMLYPDPHVIGAIAEAIGVERRTVAGWLDEKTAKVADVRGNKRTERGERSEETRRKYRNRRQVEIKDPAGFSKSQKKALFSGPQPSEKLPAFTAVGVRGGLEGKEFDPVAAANGKPQVLIFQDENRVGLRGLAGFAQMVSSVANKSGNGVQFTTIFLGDDSAKLTEFAKKVDQYVPELVQMGISRDGRDGPGAYGLNRNVSMTILFAKNGKVTHNFAFPQSMLYPDPHVLGALAAVVGEDGETVAGWLNEAPAEGARMQTGRGRDGNLSARQAAFRERLGELVEAGKLTRREAGDLYQTVFPENARGG